MMNHASRLATVLCLSAAATVCLTFSSWSGVNGDVDKESATTTINLPQLREINAEYQKLLAKPGPHWKYRSTIAGCDLGGRDASSDCYAQAEAACNSDDPAIGRGPLTDIYRLWVDEEGDVLPAAEWPKPNEPGANSWQYVGSTCLPNLVPDAKPIPTMDMIISAFHQTPWAKGSISTQPKGDVTLVNLKTFYKVSWSSGGFEPGEVDAVDPATMFGYRVEIRPRLVSYVYHFGDGTTEGPTTSPGGVYPDGDVLHTYAKPGTYSSRVDVTFGADFRINGGAWIDIPDTVTVRQPATTVTVKEAKAVLVNE